MSTLIIGATAGLVAGIAATWIMDRFQYNWWDVAAFVERWRVRDRVVASPASSVDASAVSEPQEFSGPSTARVANWFFRRWKGRDLNSAEKGPAGELVHYGFGIANAVLFGVVMSALGIVGVGWGIFFGLALFVSVDEVGLWAVGLAKGPWTTRSRSTSTLWRRTWRTA
jgi:hypothetical protein